MLKVTGLVGLGGHSNQLLLSHTASATSGSDLTTYTFSTQAIGAASSGRYIVVGAGGRRTTGNGASISSVTVGGITASELASQSADDSSFSRVAGLYLVNVPTGATADVVVTFGSGMARTGIGLWRVVAVGMLDTGGFDTGTDTTGDPMTVALSIAPGGAAFGFGFANVTGNTWTGLTEDFDNIVESNSFTGASLSVTDEESVTASMNHSSGTANVMVAAALSAA